TSSCTNRRLKRSFTPPPLSMALVLLESCPTTTWQNTSTSANSLLLAGGGHIWNWGHKLRGFSRLTRDQSCSGEESLYDVKIQHKILIYSCQMPQEMITR